MNECNECVEIDHHKIHIFSAGDEGKPKLVLLSGSGTVVPMYDFKILYEKLVGGYRIIVIEKFGYGYSELYEGPCDVDSVITFQREALEKAGEKGPYILLPHSMSGLEAIRWKQLYPDEVKAIIGLDMAVPGVYLHWKQEDVERRIRIMKRMRSLNKRGLLFWYPLSKRGLNGAEIKQQRLLRKRNAMNPCCENEAKALLENAAIVDSAGRIDCPILMFVSDGKQASSGWIDQERRFAGEMNAKTVISTAGITFIITKAIASARKLRRSSTGLWDHNTNGGFDRCNLSAIRNARPAKRRRSGWTRAASPTTSATSRTRSPRLPS